jgi:hypothetical protein
MTNGGKKAKRFAFGLFVRAVVLCGLALLVCGCGSFAQPGETEAEGHRRHQRNLALNRQEMISDIDAALLMVEPSKLSERRIP